MTQTGTSATLDPDRTCSWTSRAVQEKRTWTQPAHPGSGVSTLEHTTNNISVQTDPTSIPEKDTYGVILPSIRVSHFQLDFDWINVPFSAGLYN